MPSINTDWTFLSNRAVILENRALRVVVLPELGGRVWSIVYKRLDRELLWHNPRVRPQKAQLGAAFDNVWCGGWEEMFPVAAAGVIQGEPYPDHGEVWCLPWEAECAASEDTLTLSLTCNATISAMQLEKHVRLCGEEARIEINYSISNRTPTEFPFMFALHPAFAVDPGCRVDLPPAVVRLDPAFPGTLAGVMSPFTWPGATLGTQHVDLRAAAAADSRQVYFLYCTELQEGWCTVTDTARQLTWGLLFPTNVFRSCWLFASYGGWRNHYVVILEPSTSYPQHIEQAARAGQVPSLVPGAPLRAKVVFQVQEGLSGVCGVAADGLFRE